MKLSSLTLVILAGALAGACGKSTPSVYKPVPAKTITPAKVEAGKEAILFPMTVGNTWRYAVTMSQLTAQGTVPMRAEFVLEVKKVDPIEGGVRAMVDVFRGEVLQDQQTWRVDATGIYQEEIGLEKKNKGSGHPAVPFPIELGKNIEWKGKAPSPTGEVRDMEVTVLSKGVEEVDSLIGTVSAYRIETSQKFKDAKGNELVATSVAYWAPKIGLIRQKQDVKAGTTIVQSQMMILKQYTVK